MKRLANLSNAASTGLIATATITGSPAFVSEWTLPTGLDLSGMRTLLPLANAFS